MNSIMNAMSSGYSTKQIIDFIIRKFPQHKDKIKNAMAAGYTADKVLQFLSDGRKGVNDQSNNKTEFEQLRESQRKRDSNQLKTAGAVGLAAVTPMIAPMATAALGRIAPTAANALSRALPQSLQNIAPQIANAIQPTLPNQGTQPAPQSPISPQVTPTQSSPQQPPINPVNLGNANTIPQPDNTMQPKVNNDNSSKLWASFEKGRDKGFDFDSDAFLKVAKKMKSTGEIRSREDFDRFYQLFESKKSEGLDLPTALKEAAGEYDVNKLSPTEQQGENPLQQAQEQALMEPQGEELDVPEETPAPKIEKASVVSTPQGIGEVREIRNGEALVEVDGKLHKVPEGELQPEPEEVKKSKIEFNLDDVPEDLRSAPLNEVYAPAHRKHVTIKYNSDVGKDKSKRYIFYKKDGSTINENIIENLRNGSQLPVSSGKTFFGGWNADTQDSRGTVAYHELTKMAQKFGDEDDPSKPYWFEEEEEVFTHGFSKMAEKKLKEEEKKFNESNKKPKKKRA